MVQVERAQAQLFICNSWHLQLFFMHPSVVGRHSVVPCLSKDIETAGNNKKRLCRCCNFQSSVSFKTITACNLVLWPVKKAQKHVWQLSISIEPSLFISFSLHHTVVLSSAVHQHSCSGFKGAMPSSSEGRFHLILCAFLPFQFITLFLLSTLSRDKKPTPDRWVSFFP